MTQCIESDGNELYIGDDPYWRGRALKAEGIVDGARRYAEAHTLLYQQAMARAEKAEVALKAVEWSAWDKWREAYACPQCGGANPDPDVNDAATLVRCTVGHKQDCRLAAALAKPQEPTS